MSIFVVPAHIEEENISALLKGMREKVGVIGRSFHAVVIYDRSPDRTGEIGRSYSTKFSLEVTRQCNPREGKQDCFPQDHPGVPPAYWPGDAPLLGWRRPNPVCLRGPRSA